MKITRKQLKDLIMTELYNSDSILLETPMSLGGFREEDNDNSVSLARQNLFHLSQQANQLHDMLTDSEKLEPEIENKIGNIAHELEEVFKAVTYDKQHPVGR